MTRAQDSLFAVCAPGLEPVTEAELHALGLECRSEQGGVAFEGTGAELYRASLELRTATRVLVRLGGFRARRFAELERHARRIPWNRVLAAGTRYRLRVSCRKSKLYHEGAVAERLVGILTEETGAVAAPSVAEDDEGNEGDEQLLVVRFLRDVCTISADTSGVPLYMRGYRQALARAPLRETLASAILLAAGWTPDLVLLDPFCGSGTIALEAALIARRIPPGLASAEFRPRRYRFMEWPDFNGGAFERTVERLRAPILATAPASILASDRNAGAIRAARANGERAGVSDDIEFAVRPLSALEPPTPTGWLVTNPPYGVRVGDRAESRALGRELGRLARSSLRRWTLAALTADGGIQQVFGSAAVRLQTRNGGIPVRLVVRPPLTDVTSPAG